MAVSVSSEPHRSADDAIGSQIRYYDLRAPEYLNPLAPSDRRVRGVLAQSTARDLIDDLAPRGEVLELACGPGGFTAELARHSTTVTALDASEQMLGRNRLEVDRPNVRYVHTNIFEWRPRTCYDVVFFGFWLSHVPPSRFDDFWQLIRSCVRDDGRVAFIDEDDRGTANDDLRIVDGLPLARRTLADGREFDVIKLFWNPDDLAARLLSLGWTFDIRRVDDPIMYGVGTPGNH
jgi:demethylmenaquinone methyltransferase/2-methoxy-6-polyprenyl-1,4-benzoquinol methylase